MIKYEVIKNFAEIHPRKIALRDDKRAISWDEFRESTLHIINVINQLDSLKSESPCLFISKSSIELVSLGAAFASLGIPFQGLDHHIDIKFLKILIQETETKHVFLSHEFKHFMEDLSSVCHVHLLEEFTRQKVETSEFLALESPPFRSYSFTSGTTGKPKIAFRTSSFDKRRFAYLEEQYNFNSEDVHLVSLPMYHVASTGWLRLFLNLGCTAILHNFENTYTLCEVMSSNRVSTTLMSPLVLKQIVNELEEDTIHQYFSALRFILTGGKNCPIRVKQDAIRKLGRIVHEYYGTTETGINTLLSSEEALLYPGSVGKEFEGNHILVLDKNNKPVKAGEIGRLAISSYMNIDRFLNYPSEFLSYDGKSYLLTSDYGYKNSEGYLFIAQRSSTVPQSIRDYYAIENEVFNLGYISDVFVSSSSNDTNINIVPKMYYPYAKIEKDIHKIVEKYQIPSLKINVTSKLEYTSTGKIKL